MRTSCLSRAWEPAPHREQTHSGRAGGDGDAMVGKSPQEGRGRTWLLGLVEAAVDSPGPCVG